MVTTANSLIRKIHRNPQAGLLLEPLLNIVKGFRMIRGRPNQRVDFLDLGPVVPFGGRPEFRNPIQLLINVRNPVFPYFLLPTRGGHLVFQYPPIAIQRCQLAGFFLHRHLRKKVFHPLLNRPGCIFVGIQFPIFI